MKGTWEAEETAQRVLHTVSPGWHAALAEAWTAYCHGSYPIGAVVVDGVGEVIAQAAIGWGSPGG